MSQWDDEVARVRFERDRFKTLAAQRRKDAIECRKRRDWIGALRADDRASEYRGYRDQFTAEIAKIRTTHGVR